MTPPAWLSKVPQVAQGTWNRVKAIGPFIISQSDKMSEAYARHLGRVAEVGVMKEFLQGEITTRKDVRNKLFDRYISASPEDRIRIEADLDRMDSEIRRLGIGEKALNYVPPPPPDEKTAEATAGPKAEISDHWLDRFNDLARHRNEPWRAEMLARALALETETPGSISGRALWLIGTMEETIFRAFSAFLNLSFWPWPSGEPFIPDNDYANDKSIVLVLNGQSLVMGQILFVLEQAGLTANLLTSSKPIAIGTGLVLVAGETAFMVRPKKEFALRGILLSPLGSTLAQFHEPKWSGSVAPRLEKWTAALPKEDVDVLRLQRRK